MADSKYDILEFRCVIEPTITHLYIRISQPNDFMLIGGWYHKAFGVECQSLRELETALVMQEFLSWDRGAPK